MGEDWLGRWALNLMLIGVTTRRFGRAVRLPEGDVPAGPGGGGSKSGAPRRLVALSAGVVAGRGGPGPCRGRPPAVES